MDKDPSSKKNAIVAHQMAANYGLSTKLFLICQIKLLYFLH